MKLVPVVFLAGVAALAGCASTQPVPAGMKAGEFVAYQCEGGKRMQVRAAADGSSVRVRHEGGYELDRKDPGTYEADGWKLTLQDRVAALMHNGKVVLKACQPA